MSTDEAAAAHALSSSEAVLSAIERDPTPALGAASGSLAPP